MLFSEPKIPQWSGERRRQRESRRFSALQRAENSSIRRAVRRPRAPRRFQCSSASRKFLNRRSSSGWLTFSDQVSVLFSEPKIPQWNAPHPARPVDRGFSALQRAENSSMPPTRRGVRSGRRFSALQRAENSSMRATAGDGRRPTDVSVLFSEPKIPQ